MANHRSIKFLVLWLVLLTATAAFAANCTISGQVFNVDGTVAANATITFNPVTAQPLTTGGASYTSQPVSTQTDVNGNLAPITLPQGLMVQITIYQNGANQGGYTAIVPFMSTVSFVQMNQGINTQSLDALASAQPATASVTLNNQKLINVACPGVNGDALVQGCGNTIGSILINADLDFNLFNLLEIGGINLIQQPAVTSIIGTATCTGVCATSYTYQITCVTSTGETNASATVTLTNAASLSSANNNNLTWPSTSGASCNEGYNIYGRTNGSLGFMTNVAQGTNTFTDNGSIPTPSDSWTMSWNQNTSYPAVMVWDLRGISTTVPIDKVSTNSAAQSNTLTASAVTTSQNNDTLIPVFTFTTQKLSSIPAWPSFPGGFSNVLQVNGVKNVNYGVEGGIKTVATAGSSGSVSVTFNPAQLQAPWATMNISLLASNNAVPATIVSTLTPAPASPYTTVTFGDPTGTAQGDVMVVCTAYSQAATIVVPSSFNLIGSSTYQTGNSQLRCYWVLPNGAFGKPPPTTNTTGGINQQTASGQTVNLLTPAPIPWTAVASILSTTAAPLASTSFPQAMTVVGCRATYYGVSGCSGFPVFAIQDATASSVLCSQTLASGSADAQVTPTGEATIPANNLLTFLPSTPKNCTNGQASMTIMLEPPQ